MNLDFAKEVEFGEDVENFEEFDLIIVLDSASPSRIGRMKKGFELPKRIISINIDHHSSNKYFANYNFLDVSAPSTCSILISMFKELNIEIDSELAKRLMIGIVTDTNFFKVPHSPIRALEEVLFLEKKGADYAKNILTNFEFNKSFNKKKYEGIILGNIELYEYLRLAISYVSFEDMKKLSLKTSDAKSGIASMVGIKNVDVYVLLTEVENGIKGSIRSTNDFDVSKIAKELGGGGHKQRSGFFTNLNLEKTREKLIEIVKIKN